MARAVWILVPAVAGATAHCASFDGNPATPVPDAAADGSVDAPVDAGGATSTCSSPHALCDDFERDGPPLEKTQWGSEDGVAAHEIGTAFGAVSGTRALVMKQGDGGTDYYFLVKTFAGPLAQVRCALSLFIEESPGAYGFAFSATLNGGPVAYSIATDLRPAADGRPAVLERVPDPWVEFVPLGTRAWHRIEFEIPRLRLWYNGLEQPVPPDDVAGTFGSATFRIGIGTNGANPGWQTAIDDVVCDVVR
jgi:hypothetical protein